MEATMSTHLLNLADAANDKWKVQERLNRVCSALSAKKANGNMMMMSMPDEYFEWHAAATSGKCNASADVKCIKLPWMLAFQKCAPRC
eukprot:2851099-Pyramimonas_sp.AAC.1